MSELSKKSQQAFELREELRSVRAQLERASAEATLAQEQLAALAAEHHELDARRHEEQRAALRLSLLAKAYALSAVARDSDATAFRDSVAEMKQWVSGEAAVKAL